MVLTEERKCWECGEMIFAGAGTLLGDKNTDVHARCLCDGCLEKAYSMIGRVL
jgi:hypothetical protein